MGFANRNAADLFGKARVYQAQELEVTSWSPGKIGENTRPTEIHLIATVLRNPKEVFVIRLKTRRVAEEILAALQEHIKDVWPDPPASQDPTS